MKDIRTLNKKRFSYKEIIEPGDDYFEFAEELEKLIIKGIIRPIKNSGKALFKPNFYNDYFINEIGPAVTADKAEIFQLAPLLLEYYISHEKHYVEDREWLIPLSTWLKREARHQECSVKERSYEIFRNEKMMEENDFQRIMKRCSLDYEKLHCFKTYEPFFCNYISENGIALVLENKDPWYSISKALKAKETNLFLNTEIMYVIYGEGRKVNSATVNARLQDFMSELDPRPEAVLYCGDIDKAGVNILAKCKEVNSELNVQPFELLYHAMVNKAPEDPLDNELSDDNKTKSFDHDFLKIFPDKTYIETVLDQNLRIPQEILTYSDYLTMCGEIYV